MEELHLPKVDFEAVSDVRRNIVRTRITAMRAWLTALASKYNHINASRDAVAPLRGRKPDIDYL